MKRLSWSNIVLNVIRIRHKRLRRWTDDQESADRVGTFPEITIDYFVIEIQQMVGCVCVFVPGQ